MNYIQILKLRGSQWILASFTIFLLFLFHFAAYFMLYPFGSKLLDSKLLEIMRDAMSSCVSLGHSVMKQIHKVE